VLPQLLLLLQLIRFCWITLVLATKLPGQPHANVGISCIRPQPWASMLGGPLISA
jgi:hypothetical protein